MKRLLPLLAALLLISGCKKDNIVILTPVHVSLGDFEVINGDQTTAKDEPLATYSGVKAVTLAFYNTVGVLAYITAHPGYSVPQISASTGIPAKSIECHVAALIDKNLIEHRGSKKTGGYYPL